MQKTYGQTFFSILHFFSQDNLKSHRDYKMNNFTAVGGGVNSGHSKYFIRVRSHGMKNVADFMCRIQCVWILKSAVYYSCEKSKDLLQIFPFDFNGQVKICQ